MIRELNVYASADAVFTVSQKEAALVGDLVADPDHAYVSSDNEDIGVSELTLDDRIGISFIGNFRHPPNVEAVEFLCQAVLPRVEPQLLGPPGLHRRDGPQYGRARCL